MERIEMLFYLLVCTVPLTVYWSYTNLPSISSLMECQSFSEIQPDDWEKHQIVLYWTNFFGSSMAPCSRVNNKIFVRPLKCQDKYPNCRITSNHNMINHSQVYIFHSLDITDDDSLEHCAKNSTKPCLLFNMEPPYRIYNLSENFHYHLTVNYQFDADIRLPYGFIEKRTDPLSNNLIQSEIPMSTKVKSAAWIVSHCHTGGKREYYVDELQEYIDVDIYGDCGPGLSCPRSDECQNKIASQYYFYLSFENSFFKDYATEKIFKILRFPIVPIVYGGANYSKLLPPNSYIDASHLSPKMLAEKMKHLIDNKDEYMKYFEWKRFYTSHSVYVTNEVMCEACKLAQDIHNNVNKTIFRPRNGKDFNDWFMIGWPDGGKPQDYDFKPLIISLAIFGPLVAGLIALLYRKKVSNLSKPFVKYNPLPRTNMYAEELE